MIWHQRVPFRRWVDPSLQKCGELPKRVSRAPTEAVMFGSTKKGPLVGLRDGFGVSYQVRLRHDGPKLGRREVDFAQVWLCNLRNTNTGSLGDIMTL